MNERERIAALIARNDFHTAEILMRKRGLPPEVCRELEEQIEKQKRAQKQAGLRKRRRKRFASRLGNLPRFGGKLGRPALSAQWPDGFFELPCSPRYGALLGAYPAGGPPGPRPMELGPLPGRVFLLGGVPSSEDVDPSAVGALRRVRRPRRPGRKGPGRSSRGR